MHNKVNGHNTVYYVNNTQNKCVKLKSLHIELSTYSNNYLLYYTYSDKLKFIISSYIIYLIPKEYWNKFFLNIVRSLYLKNDNFMDIFIFGNLIFINALK